MDHIRGRIRTDIRLMNMSKRDLLDRALTGFIYV